MKKPMLILAMVLSGMLVQAQTAGFNNSHDGQLLEEGPGITDSNSPFSFPQQPQKTDFKWYHNIQFKEKLDSFEIEKINDINQWEFDLQHRFTYDTAGNATSYTKNKWDKGKKKWMPNFKYKYTYNGRYKVVSSEYNNWCDSSNQWDARYKCEYSYDENDNMITQTDSYLNTSFNQWECNCRFSYTYDERGNMTMFIGSHFDAGQGQWVNVCKREFHYKYGNLATILSFEWSAEHQQWVYSFMENYGYNADSNLVLFLTYHWDQEINQFLYSSKKEYSYDARENLSSITGFYQDEASFEWVYDCKREYSYDDHDNMTLLIKYDWNENDESWVYNWKEEHRFDVTMNIDSLVIHPGAFDLDFHFKNGKLTGWTEFMWDQAAGSWENFRRGTPHSSTITGIADGPVFEMPLLSIYPNPASDYIIVRVADNTFDGELIITDMSGRMLLRERISRESKIPLWHLKSGTYIVMLVEEGRIYYSDKVIVQ